MKMGTHAETVVLGQLLRRIGSDRAFVLKLQHNKQSTYIVVLPDLFYEPANSLLANLRWNDSSGILENTGLEGIGEVESLIDHGVPDYIKRYGGGGPEFLMGNEDEWLRLQKYAQVDAPASDFMESLQEITSSKCDECASRLDDTIEGIVQLLSQYAHLLTQRAFLKENPQLNRKRIASKLENPRAAIDSLDDRSIGDALATLYDQLYELGQTSSESEQIAVIGECLSAYIKLREHEKSVQELEHWEHEKSVQELEHS